MSTRKKTILRANENESEVTVMRDMVRKDPGNDHDAGGRRLSSFTLALRAGLALLIILAVVTLLGVRLVPDAAAATAGPRNPSTGSTNNSVGTVTWGNASNVRSSDNNDASATLDGGRTSYYLVGRDFNFSIPPDAIIDGIVVSIERAEGSRSSSAYIRDNSVRIVKGGTVTGTDHADTSANWPTSDQTVTYGSSSDLWGESWTPSDINSSGFGAAISARNTSSYSSERANVDSIRITVYYTEAGACTASAPTVSLTPASQTITIDGGSAAYTATVTNNDSGTGCAGVTYTLAASDSNTTAFNSSALDTTSVTLAAGETSTGITLTVSGASGQTAGNNTTTVTASASGHASGSNSVSTTLNVSASCTSNTPTFQIAPVSQSVNPGGTGHYTITVINNDSAGCGTATFNLAVIGDSNIADFTAPSTVTPASLTLAPGQQGSSVLAVSAATTSANGASNTTTVNLTSSGHSSPAPVTATTTVTAPLSGKDALLHNSANTGSSKWASDGGWGIAGGKYGAFDCGTCHIEDTNIKLIRSSITAPDNSKGSLPGSTVNFQSTTTPNGFGDDSDNHTTSQKICEVCHSITSHHRYDTSGQTDGRDHYNNQDCIQCHKHNTGFKVDCIGCHSVQQGARVAVASQLTANSHHIQGTTLTNQHCYQCHWEANSDGSVNQTYHGGSASPGGPVNLVIYGTGTRPTTYTAGSTAVEYTSSVGTRTELAKINQHCVGCHSDDNKSTQPFGDGKTPNNYAWDGTCSETAYNGNQAACVLNGGVWTAGSSVAARYSQTGTATWGKYTTYTGAAPKNVAKAYSAHGNAGANARGWNTSTGYDAAITNTSGSTSVLCFDCHNSHGSTVAGTTTSYTSAAANGGIFKDTTAGLGGYAMAYKPTEGGSLADRNKYNAGAGLCFDCHLSATAGTTPWGYQGTFGSTQVVMGYLDSVYFGPGTTGPQQRYPYKASAGQTKGGHFGASASLTTPVNGTIGGLCTPCHDPHGVSPTMGANQQYGIPMLKGTWMTSPYKEDAAPLSKTEARGGGDERPALNVGSTPGYHIDQNTFANLPTTSPWTWNFNSTTKVSQTVDQFAGLCLQCHPRTSIAPGTDSAWKSVDRVHNTVQGWGTFGSNNGNTIHGYTCSKCHAPHNSSLNRLMVTNCLDFTHRGRVASGGTVRTGTNTYTGRQAGSEGRGNGAFPAGGGGFGDTPLAWNRDGGAYFFGIAGTSRSTYPSLRQCHDTPNTGETWPEAERWNIKTPW